MEPWDQHFIDEEEERQKENVGAYVVSLWAPIPRIAGPVALNRHESPK